MFKLITVSALLSTVTLVAAGGPAEVCTGGGGCVERQITKDCCAAVNQNTRFDCSINVSLSLGFNLLAKRSNSISRNLGLALQRTTLTIYKVVNGINTGGMVDCCESRGAGSREEDIGAATSVC
ncbi:hypothetical protein E3P92_04152 [Wallemia ichthyophaga]|uniref:Hydrophobin n=1 Tax=Wallemia ichthyophaga TaxID=245174 RepID=A0A4V4LXY3_WALIC|nr:hypothetical protein E3P95_04150 [Wallemia ichthyophaga]TIA95029.1 hypothetical protein E3P94_04151 [Wallemia ichthyophaga]TIB07054.1 hypothetical protein E3P92_04152 [Wallemia ichthyophaga]TIB07239.1 hypothetical protein E3P90_04131 [Wallemia ichthyophaga]TIB19260.1 hypothetical protein E3P89_04128 [Wallemia ichthyophaga]